MFSTSTKKLNNAIGGREILKHNCTDMWSMLAIKIVRIVQLMIYDALSKKQHEHITSCLMLGTGGIPTEDT